MGTEFLFRVKKMFCNQIMMIAQVCEFTKTTDLHILKRQIVWYVNQISLKQLHEKKKQLHEKNQRAKYRKYLNFNFKYKVFIAEFEFLKKILCDKWEGHRERQRVKQTPR